MSVTADLNSNSLWVIERHDPAKKFNSIGQLVEDEALSIKHVLTGQCLAGSQVKYVNSYGVEFEVFAKTILSNNKTQNLAAESLGHKTVENPLRNHGS